MTREEAIRVLRNEEHENALDIPDSVYDDWGDAFAMAISALEQQEIIRCNDCKYSDTFPTDADADMPLKCLGIRYGGVYPDWFCEHAERRKEGGD